MISTKAIVDLPKAPHRIKMVKAKNGTRYVYLEVGRTYNKEKKYNLPERVAIGKLCKDDNSKMHPNQKYYELIAIDTVIDRAALYKPAEAPNIRSHSRLIQVGSHVVINECVTDFNLEELLRQSIEDAGQSDVLYASTILDLASYSIVTQSNKAIHYENYAYNHYLFEHDQRIISGPEISVTLPMINDDVQMSFLERWNRMHSDCGEVVIGYDSTNKNCQAGDIEIVEFGHAKVDRGTPIFNIAIATSLRGSIPLFYETYGGSIPDVSQLEHFIGKLKSYGYKKVKLVLDRGYFSAKNFDVIEKAGFDFIVMVKGCKSLIHDFIDKHGPRLAVSHDATINGNLCLHGLTVEHDFLGKNRYFHLFFSKNKSVSEAEQLQNDLSKQRALLNAHENKVFEVTDNSILEHFKLVYSDDGKTFLYAVENKEVIAEKLSRCGFFCIITSNNVSAEEAYLDYKKRDTSEKLFCADKTFLGAQSARVHSLPSLKAVIFILFIALIIRSRIYVLLKDASIKSGKRSQHLNVPKAIKELDKIEIIQPVVGEPYTLSSAINSRAKQILSCFGISEEDALERIQRMGSNEALWKNNKVQRQFAITQKDKEAQDDFAELEESQGLDTLECAVIYYEDEEY